ncbi:hypothetical protein ANN_23787 [Periplaneta americana]|uniref:Uncharacterized protein n=1 Tax=Periplaneta americana TaxID=6978 RepID=A0ABQ8SP47_PERAM|nr:hypothetical protein ANN_23787 [Periplaneta americana]
MVGLCEGGNEHAGSLKAICDNAGEMSPGSSTESYPAFARIGLRENTGKNLNQVTCSDRDSNPGHLVSRPDALTVTPQHAYAHGKLNCVDAASVPLHTTAKMSLSIYGKCFPVARSNGRNKAQLTHGPAPTVVEWSDLQSVTEAVQIQVPVRIKHKVTLMADKVVLGVFSEFFRFPILVDRGDWSRGRDVNYSGDAIRTQNLQVAFRAAGLEL